MFYKYIGEKCDKFIFPNKLNQILPFLVLIITYKNIIMKKKINKKNIVKGSMSISDVGRMGGNSVVKKYGKKYMSDLGKKGALVRWGNKK